MALDPSIILSQRPLQISAQPALAAASQMQNLRLGPFRQQLLEQQVESGERVLAAEERDRQLIGAQTAVNAF